MPRHSCHSCQSHTLPTRLIAAGLGVCLWLSPGLTLAAQPEPGAAAQEDAPADAEHAAVDEAAQEAVAYLLSRQNADGSISSGATHATALTSLSIMAIIGVGHQPTDATPEGEALRRAIAFILREDRQEENGYFGQRDGSRMYGHGITALLLGELLGMGVDADQDRLIREKLERAIDLILRSQNVPKAGEVYHGGWRYTPASVDSDLSITVWQVMALRSALAAGLEVPAQAVDDAVGYLRRSFTPLSEDASKGRFGYQPNRNFGYATTAAGLLAMQVCGQYDAPEVVASAAWLFDRPLDPNDQWFYYGTYYYAQGMYQRGGETADAARGRVESILLSLQHQDGSFSGPGQAQDRIYATSMSLLSLSVRYHYLPIYQR